MQFSIVIPTCNRPQQLAACLGSLAELQFPTEQFEVVVVDDGSQKSMWPVVRPYCSQLNLQFIRQLNQGPAAARNAGARAAAGRYLAFTDDDCCPNSDWLAELDAHLAQAPQCIAGGRVVNGLPHNRFAEASQIILDVVYAHYNRDHGDARFFASNNMAVPSARFKACGGFEPLFRRAGAEDREFCDRWHAAGRPLVYCADAVVRHCHDLTLRGFVRQYVNYGRGAQLFHHVCARRGSGRLRDHIGFHARLGQLLRQRLRGTSPQRVIAIVLLLSLWQVANAIGFLLGMLDSWRGKMLARQERIQAADAVAGEPCYAVERPAAEVPNDAS